MSGGEPDQQSRSLQHQETVPTKDTTERKGTKTISYEKNDEYEGEVDDNEKPHGRGVYTHHEEKGQIQQSKYTGEWKNGEKDGQGKHYHRNGDVYDGPWYRGQKHGKNGKYTYHNKTSKEYIGEWKYDKKHGCGTMLFENGDKYDGPWADNNMEGKEGTYIYEDGSKYVGGWKADNKDGRGTLTYANGDEYTGDFVKGKREGNGEYRYRNGQITRGEYRNDKRTTFDIIDDGQATTKNSNHRSSAQRKKSTANEE